jgi:membrane protease subunit HflC
VLDYEVDLGEIPTGDQKQLLVDAFVRYRIVDPLKFYNTARSTVAFEARGSVQKGLLPAIVEAEVRAVFGRVDLATLLTPKRAELMSEITRRVRAQADNWGVEMIDVRIKRLDLPRQNSNAVIERMETQRRQEAVKIRAEGDKESQRITAEADKRVRIILAEADKKSQILRGEGEGKAQEIYNKAFGADAEFFEFWQCMITVREGLALGTRYVGTPSGDILFQFCVSPKRQGVSSRN